MLQNGAFVNRGLSEDDLDDEDLDDDEDEVDVAAMSHKSLNKAQSHMSLASRATHLQNGNGISYRQEAPILNDKMFPREQMFINGNGHLGHVSGGPEYDGFKYPHLQLRNVTFDRKGVTKTSNINGKTSKGVHRVLEGISMEARGGELVAIMATKGEIEIFKDEKPSQIRLFL